LPGAGGTLADTFNPPERGDGCEGMTETSYACDGCGETIETVEDMRKEQGTVSARWRCRLCETTVPSVVAERIKHQER